MHRYKLNNNKPVNFLCKIYNYKLKIKIYSNKLKVKKNIMKKKLCNYRKVFQKNKNKIHN